MSAENYQSTTQIFLDIYDITNDLLIMKDGTVSVIITVDAMNFGLLAEEEQDAVMYAYAGLLNSLNYPIQIVIRSQTKDVTAYLQKLKDQEELAQTRENQSRIARYREFVSNLIRERNVLDKKFYVVVPATSIELGILPPSSVLPGKQQIDISSVEKSVILEKARSILEPKRDHIIGQFGRIGLYARQLNTQEIIQLFYLSYNPEAADGQQLTDTRNYTTPLVSASVDSSVLQSFNSTVAQQPTPSSIPVQPAVSAVESNFTENTSVTSQSPALNEVEVPLATSDAQPVQSNPIPASDTASAIQPMPKLTQTPDPIPNPVTIEPVMNNTPDGAQPAIDITSVSPNKDQTPVSTPVPQSPDGAQPLVPSVAPKHFFIPPINQTANKTESTIATGQPPALTEVDLPLTTGVAQPTQPNPMPTQTPNATPSPITIEPVMNNTPDGAQPAIDITSVSPAPSVSQPFDGVYTEQSRSAQDKQPVASDLPQPNLNPTTQGQGSDGAQTPIPTPEVVDPQKEIDSLTQGLPSQPDKKLKPTEDTPIVTGGTSMPLDDSPLPPLPEIT